MRVYIVFSANDKYQLPLGVFDTLRECASFVGLTLDHLKHCKCRGNKGVYYTKKYAVEGVVIQNT